MVAGLRSKGALRERHFPSCGGAGGMGRIGGTMGMSVTGCAGFRGSVAVGGWPLTAGGEVSAGGKFSSHWKLFFQSLEKSARKVGRLQAGAIGCNRLRDDGARAKKRPDAGSGKWLPDQDLNLNKQIQSLLCYRYTIGQATRTTLLLRGGKSSGIGP